MKKFISAICLFSLVTFPAFSQEEKNAINVKTEAFLYKGGPSLGNSERVRWDFYQVDKNGNQSETNIGGAYDATFDAHLPAGSYVARAAIGNITQFIPFTVSSNKITNITADFNAAQLTITPKRSANDTDQEALARVEVVGNDFKDSFYGQHTIYAPAGKLDILGTIGPTKVRQQIELQAGKSMAYDLIIPSGVVVTNAVYSDGGVQVQTPNIHFEAKTAETSLDGIRKTVGSTYGIDKPINLPVGKYVMFAELGNVSGQHAFEIIAGERTEVTVNLNAGVLAISAPEAERIDIHYKTTDLQRTLESVSARYATEHQDTVTPGEYVVTVSYEDPELMPQKEINVTVKASERTEIIIEPKN